MAQVPQAMLNTLNGCGMRPQQWRYIGELTFSADNISKDFLPLALLLTTEYLCGVDITEKLEVLFMGPSLVQERLTLRQLETHGFSLTYGWKKIVKKERFVEGEKVHLWAFREEDEDLWFIMHNDDGF
ncbi:hypothetical protein COP1_005873 [Malus domestica]